MNLLFLLKKFLSVILLPPLLPLLWIAAGLLLLRQRPRLGRALAWSGLLLALLLTTPAGVKLLVRPLENLPTLQEQDLAAGQAIVILGGGQRRYLAEYGGAAPNHITLERLRYGARLAHYSGLPVMLSGGAVIDGYDSEAKIMAESLHRDFGVAPQWIEASSRDTQENARFSANILEAAGIRRIVLVTHAAHMRRAVNEFAAQGIAVIPAPTAALFADSDPDWPSDLIPSPSAAYAGWYATHEWLGLAAQALRLRLSP
ncbi:MAG: YdcF family protein [Gammaproteobacteria bacterium]|nr:YdcF family protein [Rhodocyclaceae bacterium]MBU3910170.1 YdcF family protein [Gammaproteobacteria bacterium]MBU3989179.1 YdcF family protein [Gammaproteobacteria bacterium]MBU4006177.1 YdcF family protein [Gammaproteobacteria bacterium]MBU4022632.1 YdcF family protein [Gammaproteobacteria bacterium]